MISDYKNKIYISSCVTEEWMYSLDEFISFIVNLNINRFRFSSVLPIGHAANENFAMPFSKWDELLSIFQAKKLKYKDKIEIAIEESTEKHLKNDQTYFKNCGLGSYRVAISSNKIFKPCIMLPDDITQKNYNSILNYLEDQSNNYFNLVFPFCKDCKSCRNKKYCEKCFSVAWDICLKNRKDFNFDNFLNSNVLI